MKEGRGTVDLPGHLGCLAALLGASLGIPLLQHVHPGRARQESDAESAEHSVVWAA